MYTVAVKKDRGFSEDYERYEVADDVYIYIRQLEMAVMDTNTKDKLRLMYPKRFPNRGGEYGKTD